MGNGPRFLQLLGINLVERPTIMLLSLWRNATQPGKGQGMHAHFSHYLKLSLSKSSHILGGLRSGQDACISAMTRWKVMLSDS